MNWHVLESGSTADSHHSLIGNCSVLRHHLRGRGEHANDDLARSRSMTCRGVMEEGLQFAAVTVEGALVLLLYVSLLTELIAIARGRYYWLRGDDSHRKSRPLRRPMTHVGKKSSRACTEKKSLRSLDNLWRRMQKATNQMRLVNLRHHMITKVMMEARMQAREKERERLQQRKEKQYAGILKAS